FESAVIRKHVHATGLNDTVIVHTCAVTAEAERQARQAIRRARRGTPDAQIVVTGCSAQIDASRYLAMPEVNHVVGNIEKLDPEVWARLSENEAEAQVGDIMDARLTAGHLVDGFEGRSRAYVQIQNGCDHRCTFCVIPYGRGNNRSLEPSQVVEQVRRLVAEGYQEVVITGVDITSYGKDLTDEPSLGALLKFVLQEVPDLPRLRLSSIDPAEVDEDLRDLVGGEQRLMPHLHLSLQAGDDLTLKRMKRRHNRSDVIRLCAELRTSRPELVFGADMIAGFPTETTDMHQQSVAIIEEADLTHLHVFPYSERPGTPASRMPAIPKSVRRERAAELREAGITALERYLHTRIGKSERVLLEQSGMGHTESFAVCAIDDDVERDAGSLVEATAVGTEAGRLIGKVAA
ncbi:MAG: tRNA (N(6)-L-threonylcarbamoyladenosine(37)-C(2))-methylthiotransferase MtaB, partial [Pseudomonadota bacterium]